MFNRLASNPTVVVVPQESSKTLNDRQTIKETVVGDAVSAIAEFIGTFVFIFLSFTIVQGAVLSSTPLGAVTTLTIAFGFGMSLAVAIAMVGHISGGHLNPAVSISMVVAGIISPIRCILFIIAQIIGAIFGALCARSITPGDKLLAFNNVESISVGSAFFAECLLTFVLVYVILAVAIDERNYVASAIAPLYIGFTVFALHLAGIPLTGTSVNPARSFAASAVAGRWESHWIYWLGPILGGVAATIVWKGFRMCEKKMQ